MLFNTCIYSKWTRQIIQYWCRHIQVVVLIRVYTPSEQDKLMKSLKHVHMHVQHEFDTPEVDIKGLENWHGRLTLPVTSRHVYFTFCSLQPNAECNIQPCEPLYLFKYDAGSQLGYINASKRFVSETGSKHTKTTTNIFFNLIILFANTYMYFASYVFQITKYRYSMTYTKTV